MQKDPSVPWEREVLAEYLKNFHKEHVRERRWILGLRLLRSLGLVLIAVAVTLMALRPNLLPWEATNSKKTHTAVISVKGEITADSASSADSLIPAIQAAFENEFAKAVIIKINSPGGSAVQAGRIFDEIQDQRKLYPDKKVFAVIDDFGASGGYYVAMAADQIYANRASLVGSIGVISAGFGFTELMEKIGIERRTFTAGVNKNLLDPFAPITEDTKSFWKGVLAKTHEQFIERVKASRGPRLTDDPQVFSGLIWNGEQALQLGLIDGLASAEAIARNVIQEETIVNYTPNVDVLKRLASRVSFYAVDLFHSAIR